MNLRGGKKVFQKDLISQKYSFPNPIITSLSLLTPTWSLKLTKDTKRLYRMSCNVERVDIWYVMYAQIGKEVDQLNKPYLVGKPLHKTNMLVSH